MLAKNPRSAINATYFLFCCGILLWLVPTGINCLGILPLETTLVIGKIVYIGVAFMPTIALHFAIEYLHSDASRNSRYHLRIAYVITLIFVAILLTTNKFIVGCYHYWWGNFPKTGKVHYLHTLFVLITACYIVFQFWAAMRKVELKYGRVKKYYEYKFLYLSFLFVTCSSFDFLPNWGFDVFPVGAICVLIFVLITSYGILKHELLGISFAIKRSLVYSALVSCMAAFYFSFVYLISILLGGMTRAQSPIIVLFILMVITLVFKPIENKIRAMVDKVFFKMPIEAMERENILLREEISKQDHLRAISTLAAGMAHEIKNPLTSIRTFAEYLPKKYDDHEFREKFSRIVVDEVDRVNNIVKQLLDFSKPSEPNLKSVLMAELLDQTLSLLTNNTLRYHIELSKQLDPYATVMADRNQLRQAFLNIFLNSIQSMREGGRLSVTSANERNGWIRVSIADTGAGIPAEQLNQVFDPFYTTKEDGTGLGLAIVHGIISKHGGKIKIESEVGKGTTVSVILKSQS